MWVKAKEREKNKEKHINGAMFLTETHGAMLVPINLGSDKTTASVATGQNDFYPLYMSPGNIKNRTRQGHEDAVTLIGFLAIPKGMCNVITAAVDTNHSDS
jgi:hypothetical protein